MPFLDYKKEKKLFRIKVFLIKSLFQKFQIKFFGFGYYSINKMFVLKIILIYILNNIKKLKTYFGFKIIYFLISFF